MATLVETLQNLRDDVIAKRQSLDDALFAVQSWMNTDAARITEADRQEFSQVLSSEKEPSQRDGQAYGDDSSLVASVLRLHAMRLLYRFDDSREPTPHSDDDSAYGRARFRFQGALRDLERAVTEAKIDTAIANAHNILADKRANHRWLQDALVRLQGVAHKDVIKLADSLPLPELPPLSLPRRVMFALLHIKPEDIAHRNMASLRQLAELQTNQLIELIKLLVDSFDAINDRVSAQQALALLLRVGETE